MRIPCSTATRGASLVPVTNADICEEPLSTAKFNAVLNAAPIAFGFGAAAAQEEKTEMFSSAQRCHDLRATIN